MHKINTEKAEEIKVVPNSTSNMHKQFYFNTKDQYTLDDLQ